MAQKTVNIVNIMKSGATSNKHESTIYESLWLKKEADLRKKGWVLADQIESITVEEVNDGLEIDEVVVEEVAVEETIEESTDKPYSEMTKAELQAVCTEKDIKFHHANKKEKLIELLEA